MQRIFVTLALLTAALSALGDLNAQGPLPYDVVYVRSPRAGDAQRLPFPEVKDPIHISPGTDLMLLHPNGAEEVLVPGGNGAVVDPVLSFDGQWMYYAKFHDMRDSMLNPQRRTASRAGSDIFRINLKTRQIVQLTFQEWTPNTGAAEWASNPNDQGNSRYSLGYGIFNLGPAPLPGGRVMFTSSRNGFLPNRDYTFPNLQLFVMDESGKNVEQIGHMNLGSALHPTVLKDGRVMFSSYEAQGVRDVRVWGLWAIWPDGRFWEPLMSAFTFASAFHFQTQLSDERIAVIEYYNQNNDGFGTLLTFNPTPKPNAPPFGDPEPGKPTNPGVQNGIWYFQPGHETHLKPRFKQYSFSPPGLATLTGFAHGEDGASSRTTDGGWAGKVTHPSGAPGNDVLLVWSPGPAHDLQPNRLPVYDAGLYLIKNGKAVNDHRQLILIKNSPNYNELQPRAVAPYREIYGIDEPARLEWLPNDGAKSPRLPAGTPFGLVGSSSFYKRNTSPGFGPSRFGGLDAFNTSENDASSNWITQGSDAGRFTNDDIFAVRILGMEPTSHRSYGPTEGNGFVNHANERLRVLGEIPLRKFDDNGRVVRDVDGNPDTSFLARIPADTPFTFQILDKDGLALTTSQTWHQVRPGEVRNNCGGCHAHAQVGTDFAKTAAARPDFPVADLTNITPMLSKDAERKPVFVNVIARPNRAIDVEYYRDIKPVLQRSCVSCHSTKGRQEARLALDDDANLDGFEATYGRLANDPAAKHGIPPVITARQWRQTNASRYVRMFQSRRSLLIWKIFGRRLDGWTNDDFPTESVPGDPKTIPPGAHPNEVDIDFTGTICPPPGAAPALSENEKIMFARWVDLGAPISSSLPAFRGRGWFQDDLRPTLAISSPRAGKNDTPLSVIRIGAYDYYSGLDRKSLSVKVNFKLNGKGANSELASLFVEKDHVWTLEVSPPIAAPDNATLTVSVKDLQGNVTRLERSFSVPRP